MSEAKPKAPFTYNIVEFVTREIDIDTDLIPVYVNEDAARAAGHVEGDIFKTPEGKLGMVGVIPFDGRE